MTKLVLILAYNRPAYLKQCLDALAKCRGVEDYVVVLSVDGGHGSISLAEAERLLAELPYGISRTGVKLINNRGINWHNYVAFSQVFKQSEAIGKPVDYIVAVEDD